MSRPWQVYKEQFTGTRGFTNEEENPSRNLVEFHINPIRIYNWEPALPEIGTKVTASIGVVNEYGARAKLLASRTIAETNSFPTFQRQPSGTSTVGEIAAGRVCWGNV